MRLLEWNFVRYMLGRLLAGLALMLGVVALIFVLLRATPGDPINVIVGDYPVPAEYRESLREEWGLDKPLWQQFLIFVGGMVKGDFGYSFANRQPVLELIQMKAGNTVLLMGTALVFSTIVGVGLGVVNAKRRGSVFDKVSSFLGVAFYSMPVFWLGQLAILAFAIGLGVLPAAGMVSLRSPSQGLGHVADVATHLLLPALVWSCRYIALFMNVTKVSMVEALGADYIQTARAKGISGGRVLRRHAMPNAAPPVITVIGYEAGFILGGSILLESVFAWPGLGLLMLTSVTNRDTPTVLGIFTVFSCCVVVMNLIADVVNAAMDPRIGVRSARVN
jgi:peptide/nickel transport system permease protein